MTVRWAGALGYPDVDLRAGKLPYLMERHQIENQEAPAIGQQLMTAFDKFCAKEVVQS